jgi:hypothetical protein
MISCGGAKKAIELAWPAITSFPDLAIYLSTPMAPARNANGAT